MGEWVDHAFTAETLVAEDNAINQNMLVQFLRKLGYVDIHTADDGVEALEAYHTGLADHRPFDVILLDQQMPRMGGDEVAYKTMEKTRDKHPLMLMVSANVLASHSRSPGISEYVVKPFSLRTLETTLNKWITLREAEKNNKLLEAKGSIV